MGNRKARWRPCHRAMLFLAGMTFLCNVTSRGIAGAPAADSRAADRKAVRAAMESFVKAFEARDAEALAGHWTTEGEYQNDNGAVIQGRDALVRAFGELFARTPEVKADVRPQSLRFLSSDLAFEEGVARIRRGATAPIEAARYQALFAREDGAWRLGKFTRCRWSGFPIRRNKAADCDRCRV